MHPTSRPKEDQNTWSFLFSLLFLVVLMVGLWWLWHQTGTFPRSIPIFDAIIMAFAAFRITRLIVYDKITRWFRELFVKSRQYELQGVVWVELTPSPHGPLRTIHDLLQCPWCIGFWSSLIIVFCYFLFPWAWVVILFIALAGGSTLIQLVANVLGWNAENRKMAAHEKEKSVPRPIDTSSLGK